MPTTYHPDDAVLVPVRYYNDKLSLVQKNGFPSLTAFLKAQAPCNNMAVLGKKLGMSRGGAVRMLQKLGIKTNPAIGGKHTSKLGNFRKGTKKEKRPCKKHGITDFYLNSPRCVLCTSEKAYKRYWNGKDRERRTIDLS